MESELPASGRDPPAAPPAPGFPPPDDGDQLELLLRDLDARLATERGERERRREERRRECERRFELAARLADELRPRLEQARELAVESLAVEIEARIRHCEALCADLCAELGYDPRVRRQEQAAAAERASSEKRERLLAKIAGAGMPGPLAGCAKEAEEALAKLRPEHAQEVFAALVARSQQLELEPPPAATRFLARFDGAAIDAGAYADYVAGLSTARQRQVELDHGLDEAFQDASRLETQAIGMDLETIRLTAHRIALQARLLQQRFADQLTDKDRTWLRSRVFGCLHAVVKRTQCGYVPSLKVDYAADLERELEAVKAGLARAVDTAAQDTVAADAELEATRERLRKAQEKNLRLEEWVLADVARAVNALDGAPSKTSEQRVVQAVSAALGVLEQRQSEIVPVVAPCARLFAAGPEFRWLRRQLKALHDEVAAALQAVIEPATGPEETDDAGTLATLGGDAIEHPAVRRARAAVSGQRCLLIGGVPREERRRQVQEALGLAEVEWLEHERGSGMERVQSGAASIARGSYDLVVLLLGFMSHKVSQKIVEAAKGASVPVAAVPRGYGLVRIAVQILAAVEPSVAAAEDG